MIYALFTCGSPLADFETRSYKHGSTTVISRFRDGHVQYTAYARDHWILFGNRIG